MSDALMVSVSGVRGIVGTSLTPELVVRYAAAFGALVAERGKPVMVLARVAIGIHYVLDVVAGFALGGVLTAVVLVVAAAAGAKF